MVPLLWVEIWPDCKKANRYWAYLGDHAPTNQWRERPQIALEMSAMESWPRFASFDEDASLRKKDKWSRYDGYRPIIWDMTNVTTHAFSDTNIQRVTYSEYYAENCFKAGIFCQLWWQFMGWWCWRFILQRKCRVIEGSRGISTKWYCDEREQWE